jgi:hypothetical protein
MSSIFFGAMKFTAPAAAKIAALPEAASTEIETSVMTCSFVQVLERAALSAWKIDQFGSRANPPNGGPHSDGTGDARHNTWGWTVESSLPLAFLLHERKLRCADPVGMSRRGTEVTSRQGLEGEKANANNRKRSASLLSSRLLRGSGNRTIFPPHIPGGKQDGAAAASFGGRGTVGV